MSRCEPLGYCYFSNGQQPQVAATTMITAKELLLINHNNY